MSDPIAAPDRNPCDHCCLKEADHEGPHFYGYKVGPHSPSRVAALLRERIVALRKTKPTDDDLIRNMAMAYNDAIFDVLALLEGTEKKHIAGTGADGGTCLCGHQRASHGEVVSDPCYGPCWVMGCRCVEFRPASPGGSAPPPVDPLNHRGLGGAWINGIGHCLCEVCKVERIVGGSAERVGEPESRTFWLIERGQAEQVSPTVWFADNGAAYGYGAWTENAMEATHYPDRGTCEKEIHDRSHPLSGDGTGRYHRLGRATEHAFIDRASADPSPTPEVAAIDPFDLLARVTELFAPSPNNEKDRTQLRPVSSDTHPLAPSKKGRVADRPVKVPPDVDGAQDPSPAPPEMQSEGVSAPVLDPETPGIMEIRLKAPLLERLRHAPTLTPVALSTFEIGRNDLRILLQSRTEAANELEAQTARIAELEAALRGVLRESDRRTNAYDLAHRALGDQESRPA